MTPQDHDQIVRLTEGLKDHILADEKAHTTEVVQRDLAQRDLERRLLDLNHARSESARREATFLPREVFDAYQQERSTQMARMSELITNLTATGVGERAATDRLHTSQSRSLQLIIAALAVAVGAFAYHAQNVTRPSIIDVPVPVQAPTTSIPR